MRRTPKKSMTTDTIVAQILIVADTYCDRLRVVCSSKEIGYVDSLMNVNSAIGL